VEVTVHRDNQTYRSEPPRPWNRAIRVNSINMVVSLIFHQTYMMLAIKSVVK